MLLTFGGIALTAVLLVLMYLAFRGGVNTQLRG